MKENQRKCCKCGASPASDSSIRLYRFPQPGVTNTLRCELWARFGFPDKTWSSSEFQATIYKEHRMLCDKHFHKDSFINFEEKKLHRFAVPVEESDKSGMRTVELPPPQHPPPPPPPPPPSPPAPSPPPPPEPTPASLPHRSENVCWVCLTTSRRVYALHLLRLTSTYTKLSGATMYPRGVSQAACAACAAQLRSARQLSERSRRANQLLMSLLQNTKEITPEAINELKHNDSVLAASKLVLVHWQPDHFDFHIKEEEENSIKVEEEESEDISREEDAREVTAATNFDLENQENIYSKDEIEGDQVTDEEDTKDCTTDETIEASPYEPASVNNQPINLPEPEVYIIDRKHTSAENKTRPETPVQTDELPKPATDPNMCKVAKKRKECEQKSSGLIEKNFIVQNLSLNEQILEHEKGKLSSKYLSCYYKCDLCYKGYVAEATLSTHMAKHNKSNGDFECPICHMWLRTRRVLKRHSSCHRSLYTCKECSFTTRLMDLARRHIRWHRGTIYKCEICSEEVIFKRQTSLMKHLRLRHPGSRHCPLCGYSFLGEKGLSLHLTLKHLGEMIPTEGPRCKECDVTFATDDACFKHQNVIHNRCERNLILQPPKRLKGERRKRSNELMAKNLKTGKRAGVEGDEAKATFPCAHCGASFPSWRERRQHTRQVHGSTSQGPLHFQCHVCGTLFTYAWQLADHMSVHSPTASHACPDCGKCYKTRARMLLHRNSHTARYACPICQKEFNSSNNRNRHYTYVHSTVRDVKCELCDKVFKCVEYQQLHKRFVHGEKSWPKRKRTKKPAQVKPN